MFDLNKWLFIWLLNKIDFLLNGSSFAVRSFFSWIIAMEFFLLVEGVGGDKCWEPVGIFDIGLPKTDRLDPRGV